MSLAIFLITINGVMGIVNYCGDGNCDRYSESYDESNPLLNVYCPQDCGVLVNEEWCRDGYTLIDNSECPTSNSTCPTCSTCPACNCGTSTCDISRISDSNLRSWCTSNGYSTSSGTCSTSSSGSTDKVDEYSKYYWLVFLIIGGVIGYYYKKYKK